MKELFIYPKETTPEEIDALTETELSQLAKILLWYICLQYVTTNQKLVPYSALPRPKSKRTERTLRELLEKGHIEIRQEAA